jgi:hypothetical protein
MLSKNLINISMTGRIAYAIQCTEKYLLAKYPNIEWSELAKEMWAVTSEPFDKWSYSFSEIIPEYLYEFGETYRKDKYEYISEKDFNYWTKLFNNVKSDENINNLLMTINDITMVYAYTSIPKEGKESIKLIENIEQILISNNIDLPNYKTFEFSDFSQNNGWGENFDGTKYSLILNAKK